MHEGPPHDQSDNDPPEDKPERRRGEGIRALWANRKARAFTSALLRHGASFRTAADSANKRFEISLDWQYLRALANTEFDKFNEKRGENALEKNNLHLRSLCARLLEQDLTNTETAQADREVEPILPDLRSRDIVATKKQYEAWEKDADLARFVAALWLAGASRDFLLRELNTRLDKQMKGAHVKIDALRKLIPDEDRLSEAQDILMDAGLDPEIPQEELEKARKKIDEHHLSISAAQSQMRRGKKLGPRGAQRQTPATKPIAPAERVIDLLAEQQFEAENLRPSYEPENALEKAYAHLFLKLDRKYNIGKDAAIVEDALKQITEAIKAKERKVPGHSKVLLSAPGIRTIVARSNGKEAVSTLTITIDNRYEEKEYVESRRLVFVQRLLSICAAEDPSQLNATDRACYEALLENGAERIIVQWEDRYGPDKQYQNVFPAGSFTRKEK